MSLSSDQAAASPVPRRRSLLTTALTFAAVVAIVGVVMNWKLAPAASPAAPPPEQATPVSVAVVAPRKATLWDEFSGRLEAIDRVDVRPRVAGAVAKAHFVEGDLVKAGDLLFTIDPAPFQAEVDRADAQVAASKAHAAFLKSEVDRGRLLVDTRVVTQRDFEQRDNSYREALANVQAAEAALQSTKLNLGYTEVRAPVDGRVGRIEVTAGNLVAAGTASPVLTTLVSINPIYASFDADEEVVMRALGSIAAADGGRGKLDRIPVKMTSHGVEATGHLQLIDNQVNARSGTIRVRAVFDNGDSRLIPGQFARLKMGQPQAQSLILVDERAIGTDQDKKFVMVVGDDSRVVYRNVTLGGAVDNLRVIAAGLNPGDRIVVNGLQRVHPGSLIKPEVVAMNAKERTPPGAAATRLAQQ